MVSAWASIFWKPARTNSSKVIYDRAYSAIALADPSNVDWAPMFKDFDWFHISGITPAISATAMQLALDSVKIACDAGLKVSQI